MKQYQDLIRDLLENGTQSTDRTGVGTLRKAGHTMRFDLQKGIPLVTTKKIHLPSVIHELLWTLSGTTNIAYLRENGVTIWDEWVDENGNLGPVYGHQFRNFGGIHKARKQPPRKPASYVGYVKGADPLTDKLFSTWRGLLARCYIPSKAEYPYYGGKGVFVCEAWLNFFTFCDDAKHLTGWADKVADWDGYQLDKDIAGDGFQYSPDHCLWVSKSDNMREKYHITYTLEHDDGRVESTRQPVAFYTRHNLNQGNFCEMLKGRRAKAGGWKVIAAVDRRKGVDQIQNALDLLRTKPDDRGIIVNAWNPADLPLMALRPCHCMFQLLVIDDKLNLILTQRSCDSFLGVPFNVAFYALLTHMFAQQTDLDVGELIWNGGDVHLYKNHLQQAEVLLSRPRRPLPKLDLHKAASMFDYKFEDFNIVGYNPWPAIPAPVAV